ncbi:pyridoxal phosphate-dependent decarboxylase family protein [Photorhabdus laumondii]
MIVTNDRWDISKEIISSLFPEIHQRNDIIEFIKNSVNNHIAELPTMGVNPSLSKTDISHALSKYTFDGNFSPTEVLNDVLHLMEKGIVHVTSPHYFGLFNPSSTFWGIISDFITALYNPQLAVWSHAPACVEIEEKLIKYFGGLAGFNADNSGGTFTTGGAEANCTALICALTKHFPDYAQQGLQSINGQPIFYISSDSHLAWLKIALQSGLGHSAVRLIAVDHTGRMDISSLTRAIDNDIANGNKPFMIVGTAGTTNAGIIDPLPELAAVANKYQLFFHIDAAWAGAILLSDQYSHHLKGIEQADSITIDAHKWLSAPMGTGMFICADKHILTTPFAVSTNYMPVSDDINSDPYIHSIQWSRRFNGLKLFMPLAILGRTGFSNMIDYQINLADYLRSQLAKNDWQILNPSALPVICIRDNGDFDVNKILEKVLEINQCWISITTFANTKALRLCISSFRSRKSDIDQLVDILNMARNSVPM